MQAMQSSTAWESWSRELAGGEVVPCGWCVLPEVVESCHPALERAARRKIELSYKVSASPAVAIAAPAIEQLLRRLCASIATLSLDQDRMELHLHGVPPSLSAQDNGQDSSVAIVLTSQVRDARPPQPLGLRPWEICIATALCWRELAAVREEVLLLGGGMHIECNPGIGMTVALAWRAAAGRSTSNTAQLPPEDDLEPCVAASATAAKKKYRVLEQGAAGWMAC